MTVPRMRTIPAAFRELQAADPNTAYTLRALRADVKGGKIPVVRVGSKVLINIDQLFAMLLNTEYLTYSDNSLVHPL